MRVRQLPPDNLSDYLHVSWDPRASDARVARTRRSLIGAVIGLVVAVGVWGGYYAWSRVQDVPWTGTGQWTLTAIVLGASVLLIIVRLVAWRLAVRHRREVGAGEVITISWPGVQVDGSFWPWEDMGRVTSRRGRRGVGERGDAYVFHTPDGERTFRVNDLDVLPATMDDALLAYSQRRCDLDVGQIAH